MAALIYWLGLYAIEHYALIFFLEISFVNCICFKSSFCYAKNNKSCYYIWLININVPVPLWGMYAEIETKNAAPFMTK